MARLKDKYSEEIIPAMMQEFGYKNKMQVPHLEKIVINVGVAEAKQEAKTMDGAVKDLTLVSGQKPIITKAKKSIANFKLRAGMAIGCKVTLRGVRMYEFLDRLLNLALPRVRDFKGLAARFDRGGNYTLGLQEQLVFPEIDYDDIDKVRGMNITIVTTAEQPEEARYLLAKFGLPFKEGAQIG